MNFYNNIHPYYCGIDLHARSLYVCIIDQDGNPCVHKEIPAPQINFNNYSNPILATSLSVLNACIAGTGSPTSVKTSVSTLFSVMLYT